MSWGPDELWYNYGPCTEPFLQQWRCQPWADCMGFLQLATSWMSMLQSHVPPAILLLLSECVLKHERSVHKVWIKTDRKGRGDGGQMLQSERNTHTHTRTHTHTHTHAHTHTLAHSLPHSLTHSQTQSLETKLPPAEINSVLLTRITAHNAIIRFHCFVWVFLFLVSFINCFTLFCRWILFLRTVRLKICTTEAIFYESGKQIELDW